jgi:transposase
MALSTTQNDILALFNLESEDVQDISYVNTNNMAVIHISLRANYPPCTDCGNTDVKIKGYELKKINHSILTDRKCLLHYRARRYICPVCKHTYYEHNPFVFSNMKISALTVQNVLRDLKKQNETFTSVGERYNISPTSAASIFDQHVFMPRHPLPEYMSIDEVFAFHHKGENSKYVFMMIDFKTGNPIDILPSRRLEYLRSYFLKIPEEERKSVKMVATDMYKEYRTLVGEIFGSSIHTVDHFHTIQELTRKTDRVRIRIMKSVPKYIKNTQSLTLEYYVLKKFNWMIFKRADALDSDKKPLFDVNRERKMNNKLQRMLNYYDIRKIIEGIHPDLEAAWRLKDEVIDFYDENTVETAEQTLNELIQKFFRSGIPEMIEYGKTLRNWKQEIINSFIVIGHRHKVDKETGHVVISEQKLNTNMSENRNSIIKTLKKSSNGYANWPRFRNRCLYVLRSDARPMLNPIPQKKKIRK